MSRFKRYLRLPGSEPAEVEDEIGYHLEMKAEQLMKQGLGASEARQEALRQFGDRDRIRGEVRELVEDRGRRARRAGWWDALRQDTRFAWRQLRAAPGFALVGILTIGLGIGATTAIFSVVRALLLRPLPYDGADRIVMIGEADEPASRDVGTTTSYPAYLDWKERARSFESIALFDGWSPSLTGMGDAQRLQASLVTAEIFDVFRIRPALGRAMLPTDNVPNGPLVVWISHALWQSRLGGDAGVIGRTLTLNGRAREIVGVLPPAFVPPGSEMATEVWAPNYYDPQDTRTARYLNVTARLKTGVTIEQARLEMSALAAQLARESPATNKGIYTVVFPVRDLVIGGHTRGPVLLLMLCALVVLLIACANTSNLLIARSGYRAREFAIRSALGTTGSRIVRQLLTESLVLGTIGSVAGILIAAAGVRGLVGLAPAGIRGQNITLDPAVLAFALVTALAAAVVFGLLPALRATRGDVQQTLRDQDRSSTSHSSHRVRDGLAVLQLSLALALVLSAGLLIKSFSQVLRIEPGIDPRNLLTMSMALPSAKYNDEASTRFYDEVVERAAATPGVHAAAVASIVPFNGSWDRITVDTGTTRLEGTDQPEGDRYIVSPSYFRTMGIALEQGRLFTAEDHQAAPRVAIVDEVFARKVRRNGSALGVRMTVPGSDSAATIIGVVRHVKHYGLDAESGGQIYVSNQQYPYRWMSLITRTTGDPHAVTSVLRAAVQTVDRDQPVYDIATVEDYMRERTAVRRFVLALLGVFAALALLLASIGLYGVISYTIAQRNREFGIRLALGASPGKLVAMVLREGMRLVVMGVAIGLLAAGAGSRLLGAMLFNVSALDPMVTASAAGFLVAVAALATWLPARRAGHADPLDSLSA